MPMSLLRDIRKIYSGLNADEIRGAAHQDVKVGLMAPSEEGYQQLEELLVPPGISPELRAQGYRAVARVNGTPRDRFDFILCSPGVPVPENGFEADFNDPYRLLQHISRQHKDLETALSRVFLPFRKPVADTLITRVARENALFSLVTALPNVVPSLIELPWSIGEFATDTAFLTMNQLRLALTLAAASDRPVGYVEQKAEVGAIVASAFGWRALARELAGKIPLGGGLIPKAVISYVGTYVVGVGIEKLHRTGRGLTRAEKKAAYKSAYVKGKAEVRELAPTVIRK